MKQREDRHYQMISSKELLTCVPLCFLSSYGKSLYNVFFFSLTVRKLSMNEVFFVNSTYNLHTHKKSGVKLVRSPYLVLFMIPFIQIKSKINKKSRSRILTPYMRPNFSFKRQNGTKRRQT